MIRYTDVHIHVSLFLLNEQSDGGGPMRRLFGSLYVRNKISQLVTKFLLKKPENDVVSNQIATFDLSRFNRTSEGGRPKAPKIATTTEYCP